MNFTSSLAHILPYGIGIGKIIKPKILDLQEVHRVGIEQVDRIGSAILETLPV